MDVPVPIRAIAAFEAMTGLAVCFHDATGTLAALLPQDRREHLNPWCRAVKAVAQAACTDFCCRQVYTATADAEVVCTRCHAGLVQWAVSGHADGRRLWTLYAGVRQATPGLQPQLVADGAPILPAWLRGPRPPPPTGDPALTAEALAQLNARLVAWWRGDGAATATRAPQPRADAIRGFIRHLHGKPIALADLARHLGLSPDRARHAVREACGIGFARLLAEERLATAAQLLRHTDLPVAEVARRSGFGSVAHFHARFRARWRRTPAQLRRSTRA
jgi:AraC-like DNA-binding protein